MSDIPDREAAAYAQAGITTSVSGKPVFGTPQAFIDQIRSDVPDDQRTALEVIRKVLAVEGCPFINQIVKAGLVPDLIGLVDERNDEDIQNDALWTLVNISSTPGKPIDSIVDLAVDLVDRFDVLAHKLKFQAIWLCANLLGGCTDTRDRLLVAGGLEATCRFATSLDPKEHADDLEVAVWAASNFMGRKPYPDTSLTIPALSYFAQMFTSDNPAVLTETLWGLKHLCSANTDVIPQIFAQIDCGRLVTYLTHKDITVRSAALRLCSEFSYDDGHVSAALLGHGFLDHLSHVNNDPQNQRDLYFALSNFAGEGASQAQQVVDRGSIARAKTVYAATDEPKIRKEVLWFYTNTIYSLSGDALRPLVDQGVLDVFADFLFSDLSDEDSSCMDSVLEAMQTLFTFDIKFRAQFGALLTVKQGPSPL